MGGTGSQPGPRPGGTAYLGKEPSGEISAQALSMPISAIIGGVERMIAVGIERVDEEPPAIAASAIERQGEGGEAVVEQVPIVGYEGSVVFRQDMALLSQYLIMHGPDANPASEYSSKGVKLETYSQQVLGCVNRLGSTARRGIAEALARQGVRGNRYEAVDPTVSADFLASEYCEPYRRTIEYILNNRRRGRDAMGIFTGDGEDPEDAMPGYLVLEDLYQYVRACSAHAEELRDVKGGVALLSQLNAILAQDEATGGLNSYARERIFPDIPEGESLPFTLAHIRYLHHYLMLGCLQHNMGPEFLLGQLADNAYNRLVLLMAVAWEEGKLLKDELDAKQEQGDV